MGGLCTKTRSAFRSIAAACTENPLKVSALICLMGDISSWANPRGGDCWKVGAAVATAIHLNSALFGKGGEKVEPSTFRLGLSSLKNTVTAVATMYKPLATKHFWTALACKAKEQTPQSLYHRAQNALQPWRYPLTATWFAVPIVGSLYALDALSGPAPRWGEAAIGGMNVLVGTAGFVTNDSESAGRLISLLAYMFMATGLVTANPALLASSCLYLYSNYMLVQSKMQWQSAHVIGHKKSAVDVSPKAG